MDECKREELAKWLGAEIEKARIAFNEGWRVHGGDYAVGTFKGRHVALWDVFNKIATLTGVRMPGEPR